MPQHLHRRLSARARRSGMRRSRHAARAPRLTAGLLAVALGMAVGVVAVVTPVIGAPDASPPPARTGTVKLTRAPAAPGAAWVRQAATGAQLVGVSWTGTADAAFTIQRRLPSGRWIVAGTVDRGDQGADPGSADARHAASTHVSEPLWVGAGTEVRVMPTPGTDPVALAHVTLRTVEVPRVVAPANVAAAAPAAPFIISRQAWGADESLRLRNCPSGPTYDPEVDFAVIHHTDNVNTYGPNDSASMVRAIYVYATTQLGYCDIHYNFLIDRFGQIFEGRYGGIDQAVHGAHALGFNTDSTGIALIGDFQTAAPPAPMIDALERLLAWKFGVHGVDPEGYLSYTSGGSPTYAAGVRVTIPTIVGHRDTNPTDCPGNYAYALLPRIRADVAARMAFAPADSFPAWRPQTAPGVPALVGLSSFGGLYPAGAAPWSGLPSYWPAWPIAKKVVLRSEGGGWVLDGWGGIHPFGGAPPLTGAPYWPGWDIARDLVVVPHTTSGYVLDGWGGIHPFGGAPALGASTYWPQFDIARRLALAPGGGYVLDGWGGVHTVGAATPITDAPYWKGWDIARDLVTVPGVPGAYLLDGFGGLWAIGGAPRYTGVPYFGFDTARAVVMATNGGYVMDARGRLYPFGSAPRVVPAGVMFLPNAVSLAMVPPSTGWASPTSPSTTPSTTTTSSPAG